MLIVVLSALLLDYYFGEPKQYHPLIAFRQFADYLETRLNEKMPEDMQQNRINGLIAMIVCVLPIVWLVYLLIPEGFLGMLFEAIILYIALGFNRLSHDAQHITESLEENNLPQARHLLEKISLQEVQQMDKNTLCKIATESVLQKGNNYVLATIFWFVAAGAPGVILYKLTDILNTMWTYKRQNSTKDTQNTYHFSFFITKFYALINFIPARLSAIGYALMGNWNSAIDCFSQHWKKTDHSVVVASGAGALDVQLDNTDSCHTIMLAHSLLFRSIILWLMLIAIITFSQWLCL